MIFVDNNSTDNSLQILNGLLSDSKVKNLRLTLIKNSANVGYCEGNNIGLQIAKGKYVVFLNNDTYVSPSWLDELVKVMDNNPSIGACQSRLLDMRTKKLQMDGRLLDYYGWSRSIGLCNNDPAVSFDPFYVSGASLMVPRRIMLEIGGFDSEIFSGDFDLCWRIRLLGHEIAVALQSICYHYGKATTSTIVTSVQEVYNHNSEILRVLLKNYSISNAAKDIPIAIVAMIVESVYLSFEKHMPYFFLSLIRALKWNLKELKSTITLRNKVQLVRKIVDEEIKKKMCPYSIMLARHWSVTFFED